MQNPIKHCRSLALFSSKTKKYYFISTDNLDGRLKHHNARLTPSRKSGVPFWEIKSIETLTDRTSALKRKLEIRKKKKSKLYRIVDLLPVILWD